MNNKLVQYDTGLSILKIWMVMSIVIGHFVRDNEYGTIASIFHSLFYQISSYSVPTLMLVSFLLSDVGEKNSNEIIRKRIFRLYYPCFFFALLYFPIYRILFGNTITLKSLLWQLLLGHSYNSNMYFCIDLLLISLLFFLFFRLFPSEAGISLIICAGGGAIWLQLSGINYQLFCNLDYCIKYPLGRIAELIPVAVIGTLLSYFHIQSRIKKHRLVTITFSIIMIFLSKNIHNNWSGFSYQGVKQILTATCLTLLFLAIPFDNMPQQIKKGINMWSRYNMGIIAIHYLVNAFYSTIQQDESQRSIWECLMIYAISLVITIIGTHIPTDIIRKAFT